MNACPKCVNSNTDHYSSVLNSEGMESPRHVLMLVLVCEQ